MKQYIGTKIIQAEPMSRGNYNIYRGWKIPEDENPDDEGYLIKYQDSYMSWSPKDVFEEAYRPTDGMTFGLALEALKKGEKVARKGWSGKGMALFLTPGSQITVSKGRPLAAVFPVGAVVEYQPHIDMKTAQGSIVPWLCSQTDMLAEDWTIVK